MVLKLHHRVNIVKAYRSEPPVCVRTGRECMAVLKTYTSKGLMYKAEKQTVHKEKNKAGAREQPKKENEIKRKRNPLPVFWAAPCSVSAIIISNNNSNNKCTLSLSLSVLLVKAH